MDLESRITGPLIQRLSTMRQNGSLRRHVGHGSGLVESIDFNRRVVGSTPALAAM